MMAMKNTDFTVTLPSNSSMDTETNNTQWDYTVRLRSPPQLAGDDWEVALLNIQYTPDWQSNITRDVMIRAVVQLDSVPNPSDYYALRVNIFPKPDSAVYGANSRDRELHTWCEEQIELVSSKVYAVYKCPLPKHYYADVKALCKRIADDFNESFDPKLRAFMRFETFDNRLSVQFHSPGEHSELYLENDILGRIFGYEMTRSFGDEKGGSALYALGQTSVRRPRLQVMHSLYIFSDLAQYQAVGSAEAPLLGIVPVPSSQERTQWTFSPPNYLPVNKSLVDSIRIYLCDDRGQRAPFASDADPVVCTLRFRRRTEHVA